jgi:hypothetical protein
MEYDEYYSGLIYMCFPLNIIALPLILPYLFIKNKKFNSYVVTMEYTFMVMVLVLPSYLIMMPFRAVPAYIKCIFNKLYLLKVDIEGRSFKDKLFSLIFFTIFGYLLFTMNNVVDSLLYIYVMFKPEDQM